MLGGGGENPVKRFCKWSKACPLPGFMKLATAECHDMEILYTEFY